MKKQISLKLSRGKVLPIIVGIFTIFPMILNAQTWKEEAWERIDQIRKRDLTITLVSETGEPIKNATINVKLKKHEFTFGAVIRSDYYNEAPQEYKDKYAELYNKYFTLGEFGIAMKPRSTDNNGFWERRGEQALPLFEDNNIPLRGHTLVWEGYDFFPNEARAIYDRTDITNQEKGTLLIERLDDHLYHAIPKWKNVKYWDVINEPCVNNYVNELLPNQNTFVHWFELAKEIRDNNNLDFKLVLNENNVISGNAPWVEDRIPDFTAIIDEMLAQNAPIEMLGFQTRIQYGMLPPETQYERLKMFEKYNLPFQATEFEIRDQLTGNRAYIYTDAERKQLTEETMTIFLSHPLTEAFIHWTFIEGPDEELDYALFKYDGTPKSTGEKWIELMEGDFTTNATLTTDENGQCTIKGWKGDYDITASFAGITKEESIQLNSDTEIELTLDVAMLTIEDTPLTIAVTSETCPDKNNGKVNIVPDYANDYVVSFNGSDSNFTNDITLSDIEPGEYQLCISIQGKPESKCYGFEIETGQNLLGKSSVKEQTYSVNISQGTAPFDVSVNGKFLYQTMSSEFSLLVNQGDEVQIKSSKSCEGKMVETVNLYDNIVVYPNPTSGDFQLAFPVDDGSVTIEIYNIHLQLISSKLYTVKNGKVNSSLRNTPSGVYFAKIINEEPTFIKIIKN